MPPTIPLSTRSLAHFSQVLRVHGTIVGSRWSRLSPNRQALLVLAHPCNGDNRTRLAAGFGISPTTAWRYFPEAVNLLPAWAPTLEQATRRIDQLAFAIL